MAGGIDFTDITRRSFVLSGVAATGAAALANVAQSPAGPWRIGCFTRPWAAHEYRVALDAIAEAGFRYVGLMTTNTPNHLVLSVATSIDDAHTIGEECKKRGLAVPSAYGGDIPLESVESGIAGMHALIDNCAAAGVADLMMGGVATPEQAAVYYKAIGEACPYAVENGIGISVKPHGGTNPNGRECRRIVEEVNQKNFRIWYDPGNIFYYSDGTLDPIDDAATVDGYVVGMSVKDYRDPKVVDLTPGTGQVQFAKVMERLKQGGFAAGPLLVECLAPGDLPHLLAEAKKARQFVEALVAVL